MAQAQPYEPLSVLIVSESPISSAGIRAIIGALGASFVEVPPSLSAIAERVADWRPHVAIVDVWLGAGDALAAVRALAERDVPSVVLGSHPNIRDVTDALRVGARGFVSREADADFLVRAVRAVRRGESYLCAEALRLVGSSVTVPLLTPREIEVLEHVARGLSNKETAAQLGIGTRTVETHRERLLGKLEARNTADLTRAAIRLGLLRD